MQRGVSKQTECKSCVVSVPSEKSIFVWFHHTNHLQIISRLDQHHMTHPRQNGNRHPHLSCNLFQELVTNQIVCYCLVSLIFYNNQPCKVLIVDFLSYTRAWQILKSQAFLGHMSIHYRALVIPTIDKLVEQKPLSASKYFCVSL